MNLNVRERREQYKKKRSEQLEKIATLEHKIEKDDLKLFYEYKKMRDRANLTLE